MLEERIITSMAKIELGQSFCNNCASCIKNKLQEIEAITNVRLYPKQCLVTFNFIKAHKLSAALNVLSDIGYPEKGERLFETQQTNSICSC